MLKESNSPCLPHHASDIRLELSATSIGLKHPGCIASLAQDTNNSFRHPEVRGFEDQWEKTQAYDQHPMTTARPWA